ncbi:MAG: hypothetical protein SVM80_09750, partial [Halobacteriota archaeon]|nr:hypothetical protein [Halobacteriota archaeon]
MKEVIGIILLILICLTPLLYISSQEMMQPFLYKELAFAEAHMDEPHIFPVDKTTELGIQFSGQEYRPATSTILIVLSKILGVPPKAMRFWPIGGIFAVIALFALSRRIFNSYLIASLFAIFIAFGYGRAPNSYNIGVSAWSFPFYFLFILLYYRVLNEKPDQNNLKYIALILFIFITSSLFYYRVGAWMVAFSILLTLILSLHKRRTGNWNKK